MSRLIFIFGMALVPAAAHALPLIPVLASLAAAAVPAFATAALLISVATGAVASGSAKRKARRPAGTS